MQMQLQYHSDVDVSKEVKHYDSSAFVDGVPKFRSFDRMWNWYNRKNRETKKRLNKGKRLPVDAERWILENGDPEIIKKYANACNTRLPIEFEDILFSEENIDNYGISYLQLSNMWFDRDNDNKTRIVAYEDRFRANPKRLFAYAKYLKKRLPEDWEGDLAGDPHVCSKYAYQFLNGRLPEVLHNFMLLANMGDFQEQRIYYSDRGRVLDVREEWQLNYSGPKSYFDFIKDQREGLADKIRHYLKSYKMEENKTIAEFLHELDFGT